MTTNYKIEKLSFKLLQGYKKRYIHQDTGFTLIEMITVVLMIGILSAIALPGWAAFVNRQRLNKVSDALVSVIRQAQTEAKNKKISYSVSFRVNNNIPQYIIYNYAPTTTTPTPTSGWMTLGDTLQLKSRQVFLYTNLTSLTDYNTRNASKNIVKTTTGTGTITFDYLGVLANKADNSKINTPLAIMVATPQPTGTAAGDLKRCVIMTSLIAGIQTKKDTDCDDLSSYP